MLRALISANRAICGFLLVCVVGALWPAQAIGETQYDRFEIAGDVLIYDTENVAEDVKSSITREDIDVLKRILQENGQITLLRLNSDGGSTWVSRQIGDIVVDFDLDTQVDGVCASSCVRILLAGTKRTMTRGSRVGFHQFWWSAPSIRDYYERDAEEEGWDDPFEFTSWVYQDTQFEIHEHLMFMVRRGVDAVFAIETLQTRPHDVWYPYRARLLAVGVLTE